MTNRSQIVITKVQDKTILVSVHNDKLYDVLVENEENTSGNVGDIFVGKVQNVVDNIHAAFVEFEKNKVGFLPLSECQGKTVKAGDEFVVQIKQAAVKTKQPVLTIFPEIAGRFAVVSTKSKTKGVSKKITEEEKKKELYKILEDFCEDPYGVIFRTSAKAASEEEIRKECTGLLKQMHELMDYSEYKTRFSCLYREASFYLKYIRSLELSNFERIVTDLQSVYEELHPIYGDKVELYSDDSYSLDKLLGISTKLEKACEKKVWLKSGGNLVIEPTEALTVIDVNTGKAIDGKRAKETTFYKINCEAAIEAARQIRLRNLSGIILIDFIDMKEQEHVEELMQLLRMKLSEDKVKTVLVDITKLGLVEITRMKKNPPLREALSSNHLLFNCFI